MDEFESRADQWSFGDFERRLMEVRKNTSYQDAKGIINEAHRLGRWPKTVKRYLLTNFKAFGNVSSEFNETFNQIYSSMSVNEKNSWGLQ